MAARRYPRHLSAPIDENSRRIRISGCGGAANIGLFYVNTALRCLALVCRFRHVAVVGSNRSEHFFAKWYFVSVLCSIP